ncbi:uncharacterized protein LOC120666838 [Panicum virgatum]|uniref:Uncharacterized protein n=1 Tax=Panicum virgatum TaxID=38727 RepID=A0A8T0UMG5_PANVG|nr:uncharacterized protein LOC120666838 [Panicum virgatum]KAG2621973.1 hypothetical protein PVAP13_3NG293282 [Panicum virgatum]
MTSAPSECKVAGLQAALDGNLRLLKRRTGLPGSFFTILAKKVDLQGVKDEGQHVLHAAAVMGRLEVCKFLVEELRLDVNSTSTEGVMPMIQAAAMGMSLFCSTFWAVAVTQR